MSTTPGAQATSPLPERGSAGSGARGSQPGSPMSLDGVFVTEVDLFHPRTNPGGGLHCSGLADASHTLMIEANRPPKRSLAGCLGRGGCVRRDDVRNPPPRYRSGHCLWRRLDSGNRDKAYSEGATADPLLGCARRPSPSPGRGSADRRSRPQCGSPAYSWMEPSSRTSIRTPDGRPSIPDFSISGLTAGPTR